MRSLGDVSARPAKGLRHPEKGPKKGSLLGFFWGTGFGSVLGDGSGEGKKGQKGPRSYIYIATRTFWGSFWGLGRLM